MWRIGPFYLTPKLRIGSIGLDTNVLYTPTERTTDISASGGPGLELVLPLGASGRFYTEGFLDYIYFVKTESQRRLTPADQLEGHSPFSAGGLLHLLNGLLAGALWWATRSVPRSGRELHALDTGVSLGLIAIWGLAGLALPVGMGGFVALLSFTLGTLARAIVVPSTARRTLLIGALGGALLIVFAFIRLGSAGSVVGGVVATSCWVLSAVTVGTLASHTIFGLRREVHQRASTVMDMDG